MACESTASQSVARGHLESTAQISGPKPRPTDSEFGRWGRDLHFHRVSDSYKGTVEDDCYLMLVTGTQPRVVR